MYLALGNIDPEGRRANSQIQISAGITGDTNQEFKKIY